MNRERKIELAKRHLSLIRENQIRIRQLRIERSELKLEYSGISGIDYAGDRIQTTPENGMEISGWRLLEQLKRIDKRINTLSDERYKRIDEIQKLTDANMSIVLQLYYVQEMGHRRIGEYLNYSERHVQRIFAAAHERFYDLFLKKDVV